MFLLSTSKWGAGKIRRFVEPQGARLALRQAGLTIEVVSVTGPSNLRQKREEQAEREAGFETAGRTAMDWTILSHDTSLANPSRRIKRAAIWQSSAGYHW